MPMHRTKRRTMRVSPPASQSTFALPCGRFVELESGSTILEFSLAFTLLVFCALGIIECSVAVYADHFVANAAKAATRYAMVRGSSWRGGACSTYNSFDCTAGSDDVSNFVKSTVTAGIDPTRLAVTTTWPGTDPSGNACDTTNGANSPACVVSVQVSYSFNFLLPFFPVNGLTLSGYSSEVIID
jgi:Flp pilus assembly protein TadG